MIVLLVINQLRLATATAAVTQSSASTAGYRPSASPAARCRNWRRGNFM